MPRKGSSTKPGAPARLTKSEQRFEEAKAAATADNASRTELRNQKTARLKAERLNKERAQLMADVQKRKT